MVQWTLCLIVHAVLRNACHLRLKTDPKSKAPQEERQAFVQSYVPQEGMSAYKDISVSILGKWSIGLALLSARHMPL